MNPVFSYPGVEAKQTDASRVDDISNRVGAGAVQVLLKFSELDELSARQVVFKRSPTHKVVLVSVPLMYPCRSGCVCGQKRKPRKNNRKKKPKIPDVTVRALCVCTHVEQRWQTFPVARTGASDAARRARCWWGRSERRAVSDWWAGDRATSPRMSGRPHSLKRHNGDNLL